MILRPVSEEIWGSCISRKSMRASRAFWKAISWAVEEQPTLTESILIVFGVLLIHLDGAALMAILSQNFVPA